MCCRSGAPLSLDIVVVLFFCSFDPIIINQGRSYIGARAPPSPKIFPSNFFFFTKKKIKIKILSPNFLIFLVLSPQIFFFDLTLYFYKPRSATVINALIAVVIFQACIVWQ
jgi:hypothetical protein